jgi:hypothetical protein
VKLLLREKSRSDVAVEVILRRTGQIKFVAFSLHGLLYCVALIPTTGWFSSSKAAANFRQQHYFKGCPIVQLIGRHLYRKDSLLQKESSVMSSMQLYFDTRRKQSSMTDNCIATSNISCLEIHRQTMDSASPIMTRVEKTIRTKKRSRRCVPGMTGSSSPNLLWAATLAILSAVLLQHHRADAFPLSFQSGVRPSTGRMALGAVRSTEGTTLQLVRPRAKISQKQRDEAIQAMQRQTVESALDGVDAQMLELLSESFLYPSRPSPPAPRPRGRPEYVPGAMSYDTAMKFRERREVMDRLSSTGGLSELAAYINPNRGSIEDQLARPKLMSSFKNSAAPASVTQQHDQPVPTNTVMIESSSEVTTTRPKRKLKGSSGVSSEERLLQEADGTIKKRKRVVKNLPEPRDRTTEEKIPKSDKLLSRRSKLNNLELQKFYKTELLTAKEEYALGLRVQFMMKCEQVHEGLAMHLSRLPTIEEWAVACG